MGFILVSLYLAGYTILTNDHCFYNSSARDWTTISTFRDKRMSGLKGSTFGSAPLILSVTPSLKTIALLNDING